MTDEQIMLGLKWCYQVEGSCGDCPYRPDDIKKAKCHDRLGNDVIDLIKRQQAEIDRMNGWVNSLGELCERKTALLTDANWSLITTRAEAIKEFAEKLKANRPHLNTGEQVFYIRPEEVDNLVKEMVGDE